MQKEESIYRKLIGSFDNKPHGFSARKLSAFTAVCIAAYTTYRFVDNTTVVSAVAVWLTFSLMCLGIITAEQVIRFREAQGKQIAEPPKPEDNKDEPTI